ncbi:trichothecene 3-O-acetyltransferase [Colletotrichum musicola]|uniref:Trichothecene 3-O-acetyltransferase n=1 Tax=Colletotrichum musicola TaxID=2175873 RepID=A0A8H6NAE6_9PEZI|nr:trichothecene 3-O-acetyltransferase [Colletotrichum musicola]
MSNFDRYTDVLGQLPFLKSYTHLLLLFPMADAAAEKHAVDALKRAASKLTLAFPWLAGRVVNDGRTDTNSGVFRIVPGEPPTSIIWIKHFHRDEHPSFEDIVATKGPFDKLDGALLAPTCAFPETYGEPQAPVVVFQANFVSGGLLLDFAAQHNMIDMTGMTQCLRLFAAAMRGEDVPPAALEQGNRDRRCLIPLFEAGRPLLDHTHLQRPVRTGGKSLGSVSYNWKTLRFGPDKLASLKQQATEDLSRARELDPDAHGTDVDYVSTNDALCAFMWQTISAARLRAGVPLAAPSKFSRAVDGRRALGISQEYMGHMVHTNMTRLALGAVAGRPLGLVAADLRRSLATGTSADVVRSFATLVARTEDRSGISFGATFDPGLDVACSSWAHSDVYGQVFGALGCPELVRRPRFLPLRGTLYYLPARPDGTVDVLACLADNEFADITKDPAFQMVELI